jgi:hypothetical protein
MDETRRSLGEISAKSHCLGNRMHRNNLVDPLVETRLENV